MVVAAGALVFFWGKGFTQELIEKSGTVSEKKFNCATDIQIDVVNEDATSLTIENKGRGRIDAITVVEQGSSDQQPVTIEPGSTGQVTHAGTPGKIDIIPMIKIAAGYYEPCSSKKITYKV